MIIGQSALVVELRSGKKKKTKKIPQAPSPVTMTLCGNRIFAYVIKLASY